MMDDREIYKFLFKLSDEELLAYYVNIRLVAQRRGFLKKLKELPIAPRR